MRKSEAGTRCAAKQQDRAGPHVFRFQPPKKFRETGELFGLELKQFDGSAVTVAQSVPSRESQRCRGPERRSPDKSGKPCTDGIRYS
jgi:hypothetical protein